MRMPLEVSQVLRTSVGVVVEREHVVAYVEETLGDPATDEACASRNKRLQGSIHGARICSSSR